MVTKCRWVVEVTNSFLKQSFKALDKVKNSALPHTLDDYRIAGALINKFFKRLYSDDDNIEVADRMKAKLHTPNTLEVLVREKSLHKKSLYKRIENESLVDFPKLTREVIINQITFGTYQLKQSLGYLAEHFNKGDLEIMINNDIEFL